MQNPLAIDLDHILDHTRELWDELRGQHIFITGGTGFFGCWLLESFIWVNEKLNLHAQATVLTRSSDAFRVKAPHLAKNEAISLIKGDVRTFDFPDETFSHVIHAATESSTQLNDENPLLMLDAIIEGTRHTLDFARSCDARKFLLTSSGAVYGRQPADMTHIPEDYSGAPDPMNGGPIIVKGGGTPYRSYLYAADFAIWLWTILFKGQSCRPCNVGSDESLSIREVTQRVAHCFSPKAQIEIRGKGNSNKPLERYVAGVHRARNKLRLDMLISPKDGIARTIQSKKVRA